MTQGKPDNLGVGRELLWFAMGLAAVAGTVVFGPLNASQIRAQSNQLTAAPLPSFEVAAVKLNHSGSGSSHSSFTDGRFIATNVRIKSLILAAYDVQPSQILGGPDWINSERYDINAKVEDALAERFSKLSRDQRKEQIGLLLQSLLAERFMLRVSRSTKDLPVYALVVAKNGPKLQQSKPDDAFPDGSKGTAGHGGSSTNTSSRAGNIQIKDERTTMRSLAQQLSRQLGRTVLDRTGLQGAYDFTLQYSEDQNQSVMFRPADGGGPGAGSALTEPSWPSIFTAIQEQLGLKLESTRGPVEILVIDHIEKPSEN